MQGAKPILKHSHDWRSEERKYHAMLSVDWRFGDINLSFPTFHLGLWFPTPCSRSDVELCGCKDSILPVSICDTHLGMQLEQVCRSLAARTGLVHYCQARTA